MDILTAITNEYKKTDIPAFNVGDTIKVHIKIKEGSRERIQVLGELLQVWASKRHSHCTHLRLIKSKSLREVR